MTKAINADKILEYLCGEIAKYTDYKDEFALMILRGVLDKVLELNDVETWQDADAVPHLRTKWCYLE